MAEQQTNKDTVRQHFVDVFADYAEKHRSINKKNLNALEKEKGNILQAMNFAFDARDQANLEKVVSIAQIVGKIPGGLLETRGFWADCLRCNERGLEAAQALKKRREQGVFLYATAIIHKKRGNFDVYKENIQKAYNILEQLDDPESQKRLSDVVHENGMFALDHLDFDKSERIHLKNLELRKELDYTLGIAHSNHELGRIYRLTGDFIKGRKYLKEAIQITKKLPDNPGALMADLHDAGCLELDLATKIYKLENFKKAQSHFKKAQQYLERSLKIARNIENKLAITTKLYELGRHTGFTRHFAEAEKYFNECLEIRQSLEDRFGIAQAFLGQAEVAIEAALFQSERGDKKEAERFLNKAERLIRKSNPICKSLGKSGKPLLINSSFLRGLIAESRGQIPTAIKRFEAAHQDWKSKRIWQYQLAEAKLNQLNSKKTSC